VGVVLTAGTDIVEPSLLFTSRLNKSPKGKVGCFSGNGNAAEQVESKFILRQTDRYRSLQEVQQVIRNRR
jgi:hypothetical protein